MPGWLGASTASCSFFAAGFCDLAHTCWTVVLSRLVAAATKSIRLVAYYSHAAGETIPASPLARHPPVYGHDNGDEGSGVMHAKSTGGGRSHAKSSSGNAPVVLQPGDEIPMRPFTPMSHQDAMTLPSAVPGSPREDAAAMGAGGTGLSAKESHREVVGSGVVTVRVDGLPAAAGPVPALRMMGGELVESMSSSDRSGPRGVPLNAALQPAAPVEHAGEGEPHAIMGSDDAAEAKPHGPSDLVENMFSA